MGCRKNNNDWHLNATPRTFYSYIPGQSAGSGYEEILPDLGELGPQRERTIMKPRIVLNAPYTVHYCMEKGSWGWGAGEGASRWQCLSWVTERSWSLSGKGVLSP